MRFVLALFMVLLVFGCVSQQQAPGTPPSGQNIPVEQKESSPRSAAESYVADTYFNTESVVYSEFSYLSITGNETHNGVTIRFKRVLSAPTYDLIRNMEQEVTTEKRGGVWVVTDTPNAKIISENYDYK